MTVHEVKRGIDYTVSAMPAGVDWQFGDGAAAHYRDGSGFGRAYPLVSSVTHTFEAHDQAGYLVRASLAYAVSWTASIKGRLFGPYALGTVHLDAKPLRYAVEQAQPELVDIAPD